MAGNNPAQDGGGGHVHLQPAIIRPFLANRSFHGHTSSSHEKTFGVPQGAVLGPKLYNIFTGDLVMLYGVQYFLFVDDTGFIAADKDA